MDLPSGTNGRACWCSSSKLERFSSAYSRCVQCGSLVYQGEGPSERVFDDSADFYGRGYWFEHQLGRFGFPNIEERAVVDLRERCVYWLKHLLRYRLPPARVLELGCAHGAMVALMAWAGYDAVGVELSPWVVDYAKTNFGVEVLQGPVQDLKLNRESFDTVCMFDVLEHLAEPVKTLAHLSTLLSPEGIFLVQTPEIPERADYEEMVRSQDITLEQLKEKEHLHLFSRKAVTQIFAQLGFQYIVFLSPLFPYDMFFVAARRKLDRKSEKFIEKTLCSRPSGRMTLALLQLYEDKELFIKGLGWRQALAWRRLSRVRRLLHLIGRGEFTLIFRKIARLISSHKKERL
jgi:2-polyprenyl-3-methyl-5-hydroxy-6-metoxy-1,4-benzoquinol methylase